MPLSCRNESVEHMIDLHCSQRLHDPTHCSLVQYMFSVLEQGNQLGVRVLGKRKCSCAHIDAHMNIRKTSCHFRDLIRMLWKCSNMKIYMWVN